MGLKININKAVTMYMLSKNMNPSYIAFAYYREALTHMIVAKDNFLRRQNELFKFVGAKFGGINPVMVGRSMDRFARRLGYKTSTLLQTCYIELLNLEEND